MQLSFKRICEEHPEQEINYVFQKELDYLQIGCFHCVRSEDGAFFYNFKHFMHQVEDFVKERLELYKKGNHLYYEINNLLQDYQDQEKFQQQYSIIEQIASYFEINENNYKLQFASFNKEDKQSLISYNSNQISSDQSDHDESYIFSTHSLKKDCDHDMDISDSDSTFIQKNFVEFSLKQRIKQLKNQAMTSALERCQDIKSHSYLPSMKWKQFQKYSQYYINKEYKYFYHIYSENKNDIDRNDIFEEYETTYSPTRADFFQFFQSRTMLSSPDTFTQIISCQTISSNKSSRKNSFQIKTESQDIENEDGRYFHECVDCSLIYQSTQDQIILLKIMFKDIKQIIAYTQFISPYMTFNPINIFWDLRIDF